MSENQFKYLVEGEYVEFELKMHSTEGESRTTADNVTGPGRGQLMCQTRSERRDNANIPNEHSFSEQRNRSSAPYQERFSGNGPRGNGPRGNGPRRDEERVDVGSTEWKLASKSQRPRYKGTGSKNASSAAE